MLISQVVYFALEPLLKYVDYCPHGRDINKITQYCYYTPWTYQLGKKIKRIETTVIPNV